MSSIRLASMEEYPLGNSFESGGVDRRRTQRFPLRENVTYSSLRGNAVCAGLGRTVDMSSSGILFETEAGRHISGNIRLAVDWPALLGGTCLLKLVAEGLVVRVELNRIAVKIDRYEFRTRGPAAATQALPAEASQRLRTIGNNRDMPRRDR